MRTIEVTTDVYAALWAARKPGEESEDDILRRVFRVPLHADKVQPEAKAGPGLIVSGVSLPEGFKVFRNYKGRHIEAVVTNGKLRLSTDGRYYTSFNKLSQAVIEGAAENAWWAWRYKDENGGEHAIDRLRR